MVRHGKRTDSHAFVAALTVRPNDRLAVLLARFLDVGRCPSCGFRSIVQFAHSGESRMVLSCRVGPCGFHATAAHFRALRNALGPTGKAVDTDDDRAFEHELHAILTEIVQHGLCPACGVHGALVRAQEPDPAWSCRSCAARVAPPYFEVWRYLRSRFERGLPYRPEHEGNDT